MLVDVPCKIGDTAWGIRSYKGTLHAQQGIISEIYFTKDMELRFIIKHVCRGKWGGTIFGTEAECLAAIRAREEKNVLSVV